MKKEEERREKNEQKKRKRKCLINNKHIRREIHLKVYVCVYEWSRCTNLIHQYYVCQFQSW